ncbi:MAG TPA: hypothetical protein VMS71_02995, partial [Candidatus Acidoferrum sp.]|nr:hypothetical protein [Candidatus Acidoferrum sp.]
MHFRYVIPLLILSTILIHATDTCAQQKTTVQSQRYQLCTRDILLVSSSGGEFSGDLYCRGNDTVTVWRGRVLLATVAKQDVSAVYKYRNRSGDGA